MKARIGPRTVSDLYKLQQQQEMEELKWSWISKVYLLWTLENITFFHLKQLSPDHIPFDNSSFDTYKMQFLE